MIGAWITAVAKAALPVEVRRWVRAQQRRYRAQWPQTGTVQFGSLRRVTPISRVFGFDRGLPIDRYYIERFLFAHRLDIRGHVLEIGDDFYTREFGGARVSKSDVLHVVEGNPKATIVADLTFADRVPSDTFDCIIFIQTLQMMYDVRAGLWHLYRILKPGGVLLVTSHGISRIGRREGVDPWGEYWRFTTQSARRLFQEYFPAGNVRVGLHGNVLSAMAFLHGLAAEELRQEELDYLDPNFEVLVTVRAVKPEPA
jgi:SAM-dependent methyltransferase